MKTQEQIQQAHDILHAVLEYDAEQQMHTPKSLLIPMHAAHDVLSWVIEGTCKGPFEDNLKMIQEKMDKAGYRFVKRNDQSHSE